MSTDLPTREKPLALAFVVNVPSFFVSHRLPIALAAKRLGWRVDLIAGHENSPQAASASATVLRQHGVAQHKAAFNAAGINPFAELRGLYSVIRHVQALKPAIVHSASPKGNLYGGIAARLCRVPKLVVAVSGQGFLFTGRRSGIKKWLASLYLALIRWVYAHPDCTVIVQNQDDWNSLLDAGLARLGQLVLIPGSGVELALFDSADALDPEDIVLLPARMLTDKGVLEFVEAARTLKGQGSAWRFVLAGEADGSNPTAIRSEQIKAWVDQGIVEWWGHCADMPSVFSRTAIVCLPSYREGMPKVLLEAAAAGKAVVTTDVIGCREAIINGETGLLVPPQNAEDLAKVLLALIENPELRAAFGRKGRELAITKYSIESVIARTLDIYTKASTV